MRDPLILLVEADSHRADALQVALQTEAFEIQITQESTAVACITTHDGDPIDLAIISPDAGGYATATALWKVAPDLEVVICASPNDDISADTVVAKTRPHLTARYPLSPTELVQLAHAQIRIARLSRLTKPSRRDDHRVRMRIVSDMASGLAHEINTPVQYLGDTVEHLAEQYRGLIQQIRHHTSEAPEDRETRTPRRVDSLDQIEEDGIRSLLRLRRGHHRIAEVVRSLQSFAHPHYGTVTTDINKELKQTLAVAESIYRPVADVCLDLEDPHTVRCASRDLRYLFLQVISNAADAIRNSQGLRRGRIQIRTRYVKGVAQVSFRDNSTAAGRRVMAKSHLAVCRDIAACNNSEITVYSEPEAGSNFNIQVPMEVAS